MKTEDGIGKMKVANNKIHAPSAKAKRKGARDIELERKRNLSRASSRKHRQKEKMHFEELQTKQADLQRSNTQLKDSNATIRDQIKQLKERVFIKQGRKQEEPGPVRAATNIATVNIRSYFCTLPCTVLGGPQWPLPNASVDTGCFSPSSLAGTGGIQAEHLSSVALVAAALQNQMRPSPQRLLLQQRLLQEQQARSVPNQQQPAPVSLTLSQFPAADLRGAHDSILNDALLRHYLSQGESTWFRLSNPARK